MTDIKLKQIPQDFLVDEIYNIEKFKQKDENKDYYYFILKKTEYNQLRAIDIIANAFNTSRKLVHFAGTKDKNGITTQIISVYGIKEDNLQTNIDHINNEIKDIEVEYLGKFPGRINLGDNLGNKFQITIRNLTEENLSTAKTNLKTLQEQGVLNYFDSQRFGFANNSHKIGKFILQNKPDLAVKEILTSCPPNPSEDLKIFTERINENWEEIKNQNVEIIDTLIEICPDKFRDYKQMLNHLKKAKNDFPGSFRTLMKKLRTLYINAYQSHIFNLTIKQLKQENKLQDHTTVELINQLTEFKELPENIQQITKEIIKQDGVELEMFNLKSWPELRPKNRVQRQTVITPKNLNLKDQDKDELNEDKTKQKILATFELEAGQYATNVVKQLFEHSSNVVQ